MGVGVYRCWSSAHDTRPQPPSHWRESRRQAGRKCLGSQRDLCRDYVRVTYNKSYGDSASGLWTVTEWVRKRCVHMLGPIPGCSRKDPQIAHVSSQLTGKKPCSNAPAGAARISGPNITVIILVRPLSLKRTYRWTLGNSGQHVGRQASRGCNIARDSSNMASTDKEAERDNTYLKTLPCFASVTNILPM